MTRAYTPRLAGIDKRESVLWIVVLVFFVAAVYQTAVAMRWISMGAEPGEEATGQAVITIFAFLAVLGGIVATAVALGRRRLRRWPALLIPVAAAAWMTAHFYSYDSYYLPTLRRFSDAGSVSVAWIDGVVICALILALVVVIRPRLGLALTPLLLFVCAVTVVAQGAEH